MDAAPIELGLPGVGSPAKVAAEPAHYLLDWGRGFSLWVFDLGLACCAVEFVAAAAARDDLRPVPAGASQPGAPRTDVVVVAGTVTDKMAPAVRRLYDELPGPKHVISFGSCANSGGPYWDSYCVTKGVDQLVPVDVYVPGCPPRPEALVQGLLKLQEKIDGPVPS